MFTPDSIKKIINYSHYFSTSKHFKPDSDEKNECTCGSIKKKTIPKLRATKESTIRFITKAQILTYKCNPTFKFWEGYESRCSATYFEQAFTDLIEIGHGSFGIVYSARYKGDGKRYAVKKMHYPYVGINNREMMRREVLIHEQFDNCPGIVRFYGAWEEDDRLYMQLELCTYSLADIKDCPSCTSAKKLAIYAKDILTGLSCLHEKNILHLDIKPENIFISQDGHCKIGDFGVALRLNDDSLVDVDEGDARYLALEVLNNPPTLAADVFSVGMTLLEIAARVKLPSHGSGFHAIRKGHINPQWLNKIEDPILRALILWLIDPNPVKRPSAVVALASFTKAKSIFGITKYHIIVTCIILSFLISVFFIFY